MDQRRSSNQGFDGFDHKLAAVVNLTLASSQCARRGFPAHQGHDDFVAALEE
jgi:hypothetical protein